LLAGYALMDLVPEREEMPGEVAFIKLLMMEF